MTKAQAVPAGRQVKKALKTVIDPELGQNIVDLGLVYDINLKSQNANLKSVHIVMTLTTPGCPLGSWFVEQVKQAVAAGLKIDEEDVMVEITFDPPWSQEMMTDEVRAEMGF